MCVYILDSGDFFFWFRYKDNIGLIKWVGNCPFFFLLMFGSVHEVLVLFLKYLVQFACKAGWTWTYLCWNFIIAIIIINLNTLLVISFFDVLFLPESVLVACVFLEIFSISFNSLTSLLTYNCSYYFLVVHKVK